MSQRNLGKLPLFITSLLIVSLLFSNFISVHGLTMTPDQQCTSIGSGYLNGIGTHEPAGQTFKPTQTSVSGFSIHVYSTNGVSTPMTANIRLGGIGGAVLASFTFSIPAGFGGPNGDWLIVQFPSAIQVTPGSTYALDLVDDSGSSGINWSTCSAPYSDGCGYSNGFCSAGSWAFIEYAGDFSVALSTSSLLLVQGSSGSLTVSVSSLSNFASPVTLSLSGLAGVSGSFSPNPVTPSAGGTVSSTLGVFVPGSIAVGVYPLTITGSSGPISHSAALTLTVISTGTSDFSVSASPSTIAAAPSTSGTSTITVTSFDGFNAPVSLAAAWSGTAPADVSFTLPTPVTPAAGSSATSTLTINAGGGATQGVYTLRVTGTSGSTSRFADVTILIGSTVTTTTVPPGADFTIASSTTSVPIIQGLSSSATIIVSSAGGFSSPVTLAASWIGNAPSGITFALPSPITPPPGGAASSPMGITTTSAASTGSFTLRVSGISGSITHSVDIVVQVTQPGPKCVIATATYGSELAPEVLLLRSLRDNAIMRTQAGSNFMIAFNTWYYSFSPTVANYLTNHWVERTIMRGALYPVIAILAVSYGTFMATSSIPELAVLAAGLVASSMIGAFYVGLPAGLLRGKIRRLSGTTKGRTLERVLAVMLIGGIAAFALGELLGSPVALMVASASIVLSTLLLSATVTSGKISSLIIARRYDRAQ